MTTPAENRPLRVAVVGPCTAGKSTLAAALRAAGYEARQPAQEHSYVLDMWQKITQPDILIYLDVDYENTVARRPHNPGSPERHQEQQRRLAHARQHCDLYLDTNCLSPQQIQASALALLRERQN